MANSAIYIPNGVKYYANELDISKQNGPFRCTTKNCNAHLFFCNGGTNDAYFSSYRISDHISPECIKRSVVFHPGNYDEKRFDLAFAFESILGRNPSKNRINATDNPLKGHSHVGGGKHNRIHTLPLLYAMCLNVGKAGNYNGISIDDILADNENFKRYSTGITGYKLVETSSYHKVKDEHAFIMNYPCDNRQEEFKGNWVKITYVNKSQFWDDYKKLQNSSHLEPIIVAGEWFAAPPGSKHHSECLITGKTQVHWVKGL